MQIPLGPLLDQFGGKRIITLMGLVTAIGSFIFALAYNYQMALVGRMFLGMGTACILMGSFKIFTNWFTRQEFIAVSGYMLAAGNLGTLTATTPLAYAVSRFGWHQTFLTVSLLQVMITAVVHIVVSDTPLKTIEPLKATGQSDIGFWLTWKLILVTPQFWFISLLAFFWYANYMVLLSLWGGPYLIDAVGLNYSQAGSTLFCISLGFIVGSLSLGTMVTRLFGSLKKTILFGQTILLFSMLAMLGPAESFPLPLLAFQFFIIGMASSTGVIIYPMAREIVPHNFAATAMTCVNFFLLMGAAITQHIMGIFIGSFTCTTHGYPSAAYHGAFLIPICGLACTLVICKFSKKFKL